MPVKNYEEIEHTADIGIRVKAASLKELFRKSALSLFEVSAKIKNGKPAVTQRIKIKQEAADLEELFINWLNELLSLSSAKEIIFSDFKISKISETELTAVAIGSPMKNYQVNKEIKAATYHELKLRQVKSGWQAEIILDV